MHTVFSIYCFSITTTVTQKCPSVVLYMSCFCVRHWEKFQKAGLSMICHCENLPELIMKCMTSAILKDSQTSNRGVYMQLIM